jgi:hypothetical protein
MSKPNGKWSYDFSWTQPYVNMEGFGLFSDPKEQCEQTTQQELDALDRADEVVQTMLTFPDVDRILNKIKKESK